MLHQYRLYKSDVVEFLYLQTPVRVSKCVCVRAHFSKWKYNTNIRRAACQGGSRVPFRRSLKLLRKNRGSKNIFSLQRHSSEVHVKCVSLSALLSNRGFLRIVKLLGLKQYAAHTIYTVCVCVLDFNHWKWYRLFC